MEKKLKVSDVINYLNEHVIGQDSAKKKLAVLIKNKIRRDKIKESDWKENITPFNALIIGPTGCVDKDTEYLTPNGWKKISEFEKGEKICIVDPFNGFKAYFEEPNDYIKIKTDELGYRIKYDNRSKIDIFVSGEHRLLIENNKGKLIVITADEFFAKKSINNYRFISRFKIYNTECIPLGEWELRLMFVATIKGKIDNATNKCCINIKKEGMKNRLEYLLNKSKVEYSKHEYKNHTKYCFKLPLTANKLTDFAWNATLDQLKIIADESIYWDGKLDKKTQLPVFYTSCKEVADFMQYCYQNVYDTIVSIDEINSKKAIRYKVKVSINKGSRPKHQKVIKEKFPDEYKYCFTTRTGFWLARRNNYIFVTGNSGKTELFRRLATYLDVAFCKVDISSYTKSGYVGNSVDEIISEHLYESAKRKAIANNKEKLYNKYYNSVVRFIAKAYFEEYENKEETNTSISSFFTNTTEEIKSREDKINEIIEKIKKGDKEILNKEVTIEYETYDVPPQFKSLPASHKEQFKVIKTATDKVGNLIDMLINLKIENMVDSEMTGVIKEYIENGIVFVDEIDKIAGGNNDSIDTAGVQKELLTLVEGKTVMTDIGPVKTDHIMFIAAGAFHTSKPSELLPELQGRFPVRIVLRKLTKEDLKRILIEPKYSIIKRIQKLYEVDNIKIIFDDSAIEKIAEYCEKFNSETDDLGARRLFTLISMITEDIDFDIEQNDNEEIEVVFTGDIVEKKIEEKSDEIKSALSYIEDSSSIGFLT